MYTRTLRYGKGYSGNSGNRCWIAAIHGTDKQYGLNRTFLDPDKVDREHFNRPRTMVDFTWELDAGLYEASESGERSISPSSFTTRAANSKLLNRRRSGLRPC